MKNVNLLILLLFACFFSNGLHAEMVKGDLHKYPRLLVAVLYEDYSSVDTAMIKIYDKEHNYLAEYHLSPNMMGMLHVVDTVHIQSEGTYFAVVSKPGYKTVETECFATREIVGIARTAMLVPEGEGKKGNVGGIIVIAIVIVLAIGVWWMVRKKCKRRIKLIQ